MEIADAGRDNAVESGFTEFVPEETRTVITEERVRRGENQAMDGVKQFADVCNTGIALAGMGATFSTGKFNYLTGDKKVNTPQTQTYSQTSANNGVSTSGVKRGMNNPKVKAAKQYGDMMHNELKAKVKAKPGWKSEPTYKDPATGKDLKPDVETPSGNLLEYKPRTPSGVKKGKADAKYYEKALEKKTRVIYYDPPGAKNIN